MNSRSVGPGRPCDGFLVQHLRGRGLQRAASAGNPTDAGKNNKRLCSQQASRTSHPPSGCSTSTASHETPSKMQ